MVGRTQGTGAKCSGSVVPQVMGLGSCPATPWLLRFHTGLETQFPHL